MSYHDASLTALAFATALAFGWGTRRASRSDTVLMAIAMVVSSLLGWGLAESVLWGKSPLVALTSGVMLIVIAMVYLSERTRE